EVLQRVGLGYIKVGQQATTLSGGEAQRVKLAKELSKRATGRTIYILDEPTTGLHFHDVAKLLDVLHELVESGNTVVVIEHNLEVIKTADWIIDLGPEGGDGGGEIVAAGTPEDVAAEPRSYTGQYLKELFKRRPGKDAPTRPKKASAAAKSNTSASKAASKAKPKKARETKPGAKAAHGAKTGAGPRKKAG
ncbi:MAG: excinuclease ABC subunit A, partial [Alphaproteobacteria bacterium HGW-Alphaproteobacteria-12]